ncbi:MAG: DEAD/DEAH box helicase family protein, partial [Mariprofundales bacterium]
MKIQFNPDLEYQHNAINAVLGIFEGQEAQQINFSVPRIKKPQLDMFSDSPTFGVGNKNELWDSEILENLQKVQLGNGLKKSNSLNSMDFSIEMETGTGKTYVYLRTIFAINRKCGFSKFIIVVPSIAIKEGVYKSLQITEEHFKELYDNVSYDYFIYDSSKPSDVRNFATNDSIQIMVINIDAFRKSFSDPSKETKANIIHRVQDKLNGMKPIEFIRDTNPIVIIDEPQSVDTTAKAKEAIASLNPLCTLRYSATHKDKHHLLYKLDAIDAYEQKLVKQIEVASIQVHDGHNKAYIKLLSVDIKTHTAKIELDVAQSGKTQRKVKKVKSGTDLLNLSGGRGIYDGYVINDVYCEPDNEYIDFTSMSDVIRLHQVIGAVNEDQYKRLQIRKTIEEHLEKELRLRPKGLKVLSLFFLDKVANYRYYDEAGNPQNGKYAKIFEDEYAKLIKKPKYNTLFAGIDLEALPKEVHNGYFAIDKKKDTKGNGFFKESKGDGKTIADGSAYNIIMKDKEKLLSFDCKLKFIFSHSALKEGWDNPNVFQICTLNETSSVIKKRQEIGRGLRIAVNQDGERVYGFDVNTLTVMANESYEDFVKKLQREIEDDEGIRFGVVEQHMFANIVIDNDSHKDECLGTEASESIWNHLREQKYIDSKGKVDDSLKRDLKENKINLPQQHIEHADQIVYVLKKVSGNLNIKDAGKRESIKLNKKVYLGQDFKELWQRIKYKTTFRVDFNVQDLIDKCSNEIKYNLRVGKTRFIYEKDKVQVLRGGLEGEDAKKKSIYVYDAKDFNLPDVVSYLQNETNLTRKTIVDILIKSDQLQKFKNNPQKYMDEVSSIIKQQ